MEEIRKYADFWLEKVKGRVKLGGAYVLFERNCVCVCVCVCVCACVRALDLPLYETFAIKDSWVY